MSVKRDMAACWDSALEGGGALEVDGVDGGEGLCDVGLLGPVGEAEDVGFELEGDVGDLAGLLEPGVDAAAVEGGR